MLEISWTMVSSTFPPSPSLPSVSLPSRPLGRGSLNLPGWFLLSASFRFSFRNLGNSYLLSPLAFPRLLRQPTPSQTLLHRPPHQTPFHSHLGRDLPDAHLPFSLRLRLLHLLQTLRPTRHLSRARPKDQLRSSSIRVRRRKGQARSDWIRYARGWPPIRSRLLHQQEKRDLARRRSKGGFGGSRVQGSRSTQQHRTISTISSSQRGFGSRLPLQPSRRSTQLMHHSSRPKAYRTGRLGFVDIGHSRRLRLGSPLGFLPWTVSQLSSSPTLPRPSSPRPTGRPHFRLPLSLNNLLDSSLQGIRRSRRVDFRGGGGIATQLVGSRDGWKEKDCRSEGRVD